MATDWECPLWTVYSQAGHGLQGKSGRRGNISPILSWQDQTVHRTVFSKTQYVAVRAAGNAPWSESLTEARMLLPPARESMRVIILQHDRPTSAQLG